MTGCRQWVPSKRRAELQSGRFLVKHKWCYLHLHRSKCGVSALDREEEFIPFHLQIAFASVIPSLPAVLLGWPSDVRFQHQKMSVGMSRWKCLCMNQSKQLPCSCRWFMHGSCRAESPDHGLKHHLLAKSTIWRTQILFSLLWVCFPDFYMPDKDNSLQGHELIHFFVVFFIQCIFQAHPMY